jgi:hypothetical protein
MRKTKKKRRGGKLDETAKQVVSELLDNKPTLNELEKLCPNSGTCVSLGPYGKHIKKIFRDFKDFSLVAISSIKSIGGGGQNGVVFSIPFEIGKYTTYAVLKCAKNPESDNLLYEYLIGKYFINSVSRSFPCFLETYDLYKFEDEWVLWDVLKNYSLKNNIRKLKRLDDEDMKTSCILTNKICFTMQHFDNLTTLNKMMNTAYTAKSAYDVFNVLYQVYFALDQLKDKYTHYDLHTDNVCVYKPYPGKNCVLMRYHYTKENKVIEFKTEYIAKIIDYGRNYFYVSKSFNTRELVKEVCQLQECAPDCGIYNGYLIISGSMSQDKGLSQDYMIDPIQPNRSHDLLLAKRVIIDESYENYLPKTAPPLDLKYTTEYGTPEDNSGDPDLGKVKNVSDFHIYLKRFVIEQIEKKSNYGNDWNVAATINIYDDNRDYEVTGEADPEIEIKKIRQTEIEAKKKIQAEEEEEEEANAEAKAEANAKAKAKYMKEIEDEKNKEARYKEALQKLEAWEAEQKKRKEEEANAKAKAKYIKEMIEDDKIKEARYKEALQKLEEWEAEQKKRKEEKANAKAKAEAEQKKPEANATAKAENMQKTEAEKNEENVEAWFAERKKQKEEEANAKAKVETEAEQKTQSNVNARRHGTDIFSITNGVSDEDFETVVKNAIGRGIDINKQKRQTLNTLLHEAILTKNEHRAKILIQLGANVNIQNAHAETPLNVAVKENLKDKTVFENLFRSGGSNKRRKRSVKKQRRNVTKNRFRV